MNYQNLLKKIQLMKNLSFNTKDEADTKNAILEIRAGTGGLEQVFSLEIC